MEKLREEIAEIEAQAEELGTDKVLLYDLLIVAYYKQKDLIVVLETQQPAPITVVDTDEIERLSFELATLKGKFAIEEVAKEIALQQLLSIADIVCPNSK